MSEQQNQNHDAPGRQRGSQPWNGEERRAVVRARRSRHQDDHPWCGGDAADVDPVLIYFDYVRDMRMSGSAGFDPSQGQPSGSHGHNAVQPVGSGSIGQLWHRLWQRLREPR